MKMHLRYLSYVLRHKWFVLRAGLRTGAPLWNLIIHDFSKFSRVEWGPYARRFFGGRGGVLDKSADPLEFRVAWRHHWQHNPHHWEYWDSAEMPEAYVREMVADWMGAGRAQTGTWEASEWYAKNGYEMGLHPRTRQRVEELLNTTQMGNR